MIKSNINILEMITLENSAFSFMASRNNLFNTVIKAGIFYYILQILAVQFQTLKTHRMPSPLHSINRTVTVEYKIEHVHQTRSYLVQSQIETIEDNIDDSYGGFSDMMIDVEITEKIRANLKEIERLESEALRVIDQNPLPRVSESQLDFNKNNLLSLSLSNSTSFMHQRSFADYTSDELVVFRDELLQMISSVGKYSQIGNDFLPEEMHGEEEYMCDFFLRRSFSPRKWQEFATLDALVSRIETIKTFLNARKEDSLTDETKQRISQALTEEWQQQYINSRHEIDDMIESLQELATGEILIDEFENHSNCAVMDDIDMLLTVAMSALRERSSIIGSLSSIVGNLD